jgi:hypothetical protein
MQTSSVLSISQFFTKPATGRLAEGQLLAELRRCLSFLKARGAIKEQLANVGIFYDPAF